MKEVTMKMMLIVTVALAILGIVIKTVNNTDYYHLVQSIKYNASEQKEQDK